MSEFLLKSSDQRLSVQLEVTAVGSQTQYHIGRSIPESVLVKLAKDDIIIPRMDCPLYCIITFNAHSYETPDIDKRGWYLPTMTQSPKLAACQCSPPWLHKPQNPAFHIFCNVALKDPPIIQIQGNYNQPRLLESRHFTCHAGTQDNTLYGNSPV